MLQVVAMENNAAMNIGVHVPFGNKVFSRNMHKRWVARSYGNSVLLWKELPYCSPYWLYQFTCPLTVQEGSLFSLLSLELFFVEFLMIAIQTGVK